MPRDVTIPAETFVEEIQSLEEYPNAKHIRVTVGKLGLNNEFVVPQQFSLYKIQGEMYTELNGPPTSWAPDKPDGTFRNQDLWHFIDLLRGE
jgi:hypothetical protein